MKLGILLVAFSVLGIVGCSVESHIGHTIAMTSPTHAPKVEFLFFEGCPNHVGLRRSLDEAMEGSGGQIRYEAFDMESLNENDPRLRWGSPTILMDGRDLFGLAPAAEPSLMCRVYPDGIPSGEEITTLLNKPE